MDLDIYLEINNVIEILMKKSIWGKCSDMRSLVNNLNNEVEEFIQAYENNDCDNSLEEAADIVMILFCILYKMGKFNQNTHDEILHLIVNKLRSRYRNLYEGKKMEKNEETRIWKDAKEIENTRNYMFCNNIKCKAYGKIGESNIINQNGFFVCSKCGNKIKKAKDTMLFYNRKNRKYYISIVIKYILAFCRGEESATEMFEIDESKIFNFFCKEILKPENNLAQYFIDYVSEKYSVEKKDVSQFCKIILDNFTENQDAYKGNKMSRSDLLNLTMDVKKRIDKVVQYDARSWNNQLVNKYLLELKEDSIDRIIECMTIIHYKDEAIRDLTIELSNMYNCVVGCRFCASGALPETTVFLDSLDYVRQLNTCIKESGIDPNEFEHFYVSFAGIGEPSSYKEIAEGMDLIMNMYPNVEFNIATMGFDNRCFKYWDAKQLPIRTLQIPFYSDISERLHFVVENLNDDYNFEDILIEALEYKRKHSKCRIKINYIVMKDINDSDEDVYRMCGFLENAKHDIMIKISYLNYTKPSEKNNLESPGEARLYEIKKIIEEKHFQCYVFGTSINSELGCGQLAQNHISSKLP